MSKIISFKGKLNIGQQDRIKLSTIKGKKGYKINKFQLIGTTPGKNAAEYIGQIFNKDQTGNITDVVDFSNTELLAVVFMNIDTNPAYVSGSNIIFDNVKTNQDIFINITDAGGNTVPCNYYIELEVMDLSDVETTMLTLQSLRTIASQ